MKTETEVYNEIINYINGDKHNRPCTLASIKKVLRTQKVVDLIFSRPDIFKLDKEIKHIPEECMTEEVLVKYILSYPKYFTSLDESLQTLPVLLAFEFSKRRYERISAHQWGPWAEKISYTGLSIQYRSSISDICDTISKNIDENQMLRNYLMYIETTSNEIFKYCQSSKQELQKEEKYIPKYRNIDFGINDRVFIFVSGYPDSGKTLFSRILSSIIESSIYLDSDELLEKDLLCVPLPRLIGDDKRVIILSDIYADRFFKKEELGNATVINILIEPTSIEKMYRNSKYMQHIPFDDYKKYEIDRIKYDSLENPLIVKNDYTDKINIEVDRALEEIAKRLGVVLSNNQPNKSNLVLKRELK